MVIRHRKFWAAVLIVAMLVIPVRRSEAIIPLIAGWLLTIGGSTLITDIGFGITGLLAGAIWYDCNKFTSMSVCTNKPASMPASSAPPAALTVNLTPDGKRTNPDPTKFDDPAAGKRDVTPKSQFKVKLAAPSTAGVPSPPNNPPPTLVDTVSYFDPTAASGVNSPGMPKWRYDKSHANGDARIVTVFYTNDSVPGQLTATTIVYQALTIPLSKPLSNFSPIPQVDQDAINNAKNAAMASLRADFPNAWDPATSPVGIGSPSAIGEQVWRIGVALQFPPQYVKYGCDAGYRVSGDSCVLSDASKIQKPSTTPCEVLYDASAKVLMTDQANPNCAGQATVNGSNIEVKSSGDNTALSINLNSAGGFDVTKTNSDGTTITASTGPYDGVGGGYPITGTKSGNGRDPNGTSCGVAGYPACNVAMSVDTATQSAQGTAQNGITNGVGALQGSVNSISDSQFKWNFIPQIPSAKCVDPSIRNPLNDSLISMPICRAFNGLSFFINCVLAVLCLYGCKQQVEAALEA